MRTVLVIMLAMALMVIDQHQRHLHHFRSALSLLIAPIHYAVDLPVELGRWALATMATREKLSQENTLLKAELQSARVQLQRFAALESENLRLRELLDSSFALGDQILVAELLAVDLDPYRHQVVVNKGSGNGVFLGQPVVDAAGVAGQVTQVGPLSATIILITDPSHAIPVQVNRNGLRAIAMGVGAADRLNIPFLPNNADIEVGDLLITSGLGGRFPRGYPVAEVTEITPNPGAPFATIGAAPSAQLGRSREVLLVWPQGETLAQKLPTPTEEGQP